MEESKSILSIDLTIAIVQVTVFIVMVAILWKAAWKPFKAFVRNRQDSIARALQQAEDAKRTVAKLEQDYHARVKEIEEKSQTALAEAKSEAGKVRDEILRQAHEEALAMRAKNQLQIDEERRVVVRELRADIARLSVSIAEKIVEHSIDASAHDKFINETLASVTEKSLRGEESAS